VKNWWIILIVAVVAIPGLVFLLTKDRGFDVKIPTLDELDLPDVPEATSTTSTEETAKIVLQNNIEDLPKQKRLNPAPEVIKAIYITSWSASSDSRVSSLIDLIKKTELNAVVIDIKDYSGYVAYDIQNEDVEKYGAKEIRIRKPNALIKRLHDEGIYIIARQTVFQDPVLAAARPDLAVKNSATGKTWLDNKGIAWMDTASKEVWDYNIAIAKDAADRGFDEINFDYIRFPSDGNLDLMQFPVYDINTQFKRDIIRDFFQYLRENTSGIVISADLFGLSTVNSDDLGIGQNIEDAYKNFDYVCPMVYPSHYASGFIGYKNPAAFPYEVIKYSMDAAMARLKILQQSTSTPSYSLAKLRPWLQDFDLGATYTADMVKKEKQAVYDAGILNGWMLWDPRNEYTKEALDLQ
jgi:hypothetical protein